MLAVVAVWNNKYSDDGECFSGWPCSRWMSVDFRRRSPTWAFACVGMYGTTRVLRCGCYQSMCILLCEVGYLMFTLLNDMNVYSGEMCM